MSYSIQDKRRRRKLVGEHVEASSAIDLLSPIPQTQSNRFLITRLSFVVVDAVAFVLAVVIDFQIVNPDIIIASGT